jgi:replication factor A2
MNDDEAGFDQPSSQATSTQSSQPGGKGKFRSTDAQSVLPVCVYQIQTAKHDSNDASFRIGNTEVNVVTIVAKVDSSEVKPQKTVIMVSDGTGSIEVNLWIDQNANNYLSQQRDIAQYVYVHFY